MRPRFENPSTRGRASVRTFRVPDGQTPLGPPGWPDWLACRKKGVNLDDACALFGMRAQNLPGSLLATKPHLCLALPCLVKSCPPTHATTTFFFAHATASSASCLEFLTSSDTHSLCKSCLYSARTVINLCLQSFYFDSILKSSFATNYETALESGALLLCATSAPALAALCFHFLLAHSQISAFYCYLPCSTSSRSFQDERKGQNSADGGDRHAGKGSCPR